MWKSAFGLGRRGRALYGYSSIVSALVIIGLLIIYPSTPAILSLLVFLAILIACRQLERE